MRRSLLGAGLGVGGAACPATTTQRPTLRPTARTMPRAAAATPRPTAAAPTPTRAPTPRPKPTRRPARVTFGKLTYSATGCWSSGWADPQGHQRGGVQVRFAVTATNRGERQSAPVWLVVESTDAFESDPGSTYFNPGDAARFRIGGRGIALRGPELRPGASVRLSWDVVFLTPFDVHYTVVGIAARNYSAMQTSVADGDGQWWSAWTSSVIC